MRNNKLINFILYSLIALLILTSLFIGLRLLTDKEKDINEVINNGEAITYTVTFSLNGADTIDNKKLICVASSNQKCEVMLPNTTRNGGTVLGYSTNKDSKIPDYLPNTYMTITNDVTLYVISYRVNTLYIKADNVDFVSSDKISCTVYNSDTECIVTIPTFNKIGYENKGYSTSSTSTTGYIYPNEEYKLSRDTTIYPIYNTSSRSRKININKTLVVNDSFVEIEEGCPESIYNKYLDYLNEIRVYAPYLLFGNKVTFVVDKSFNEVWGPQYVGMNFGPRKLRAFDVRCSDEILNDYYATMVHELSHSWDYYYSTKFDNTITGNSDIINLFNKYSKQSNRPFREYSYTTIFEFFADMEKYYYFKYIKPTAGYRSLNYPQDIKNVMEKYICIAKNNYDDTKCK